MSYSIAAEPNRQSVTGFWHSPLTKAVSPYNTVLPYRAPVITAFIMRHPHLTMVHYRVKQQCCQLHKSLCVVHNASLNSTDNLSSYMYLPYGYHLKFKGSSESKEVHIQAIQSINQSQRLSSRAISRLNS